jgi:phosphoribosylamine--glycine ligase
MASPGYPGSYPKGLPIQGLDVAARISGVKVFHAGTAQKDGEIVTNGGRVLGVTATGPNLRSARDLAYKAADQIQFEGVHMRRDIAAKYVD